MAMDPMDREPNVYNRETNITDTSSRGSNTLAYVIGGLVVALGLLAFLFYDGGDREVSTTGSTTGTEQTDTAPASPPASPASPPASAPATPSSPAPSAPANPQ